tara:strand:+ start:338 stop:553 length:216 start_codon:yes stop_codon:yes gene_type:complete
MKIKAITRQCRRDFFATYECEWCEHEMEASGYDDANFHANVIPNMPCPQCERIADNTYRPLMTKYLAEQVI